MKIRLLVLNKGGGSIIKSMIKWRKSATSATNWQQKNYKKTTSRAKRVAVPSSPSNPWICHCDYWNR